MAAIDETATRPNKAIKSVRIHIPDDSDVGTGTFTAITKPVALKPRELIVAGIANATKNFEIIATFNPDPQTLAVLLDNPEWGPSTATVFKLPRYVRWNTTHTLMIQFAGRKILAAFFDGKPLAEGSGNRALGTDTTHLLWRKIQRNRIN